MPILTTLVVAGVGLAIGRRLAALRTEETAARAPEQGPEAAPTGRLEAAYQRFVTTRVDPLFGGARAQAMSDRGAQGDELTARNRAINRDVGLSGALAATTVVTLSLNPWVRTALTVPVAANLIWRRYRYAADAADEGLRSKKVAVLSTVNLSVVWLGGYYAAGATILALAYLGDKLHSLTESRMQERVSDAFRPADGVARRVVDDALEAVDVHRLVEGDIVLVVAGQPLPADGTVVAGHGLVDQGWLTGESRPIEVGVGDEVFASTTLLDGELRLAVTRAGEATAVARVGQLLESMSTDQSAIISRAARLADASVAPAVAAIALAGVTVGFRGMAAIGTTVFGLNLDFNGPIAMLTHVNEAATRGALFKDGLSLEQLSEVDVVVFDKTGVLTEPGIRLADVTTHGAMDAETVLSLAAAVERDQPHPIAAAIRAAAEERGLDAGEPTRLEARLGHGVVGDVARRRVAVGNARWIEALGVPLPDGGIDPPTTAGLTRVYVAVDGAVVGELTLEAPLRAEAVAVVDDLRARGLEVAIVSGDAPEATRQIAEALDVDWFVGGALPEDKAAIVTRLQDEQGRRVLFVGDGINDAVALKAARVSASLGGASEVATTVARVVLLDGTLRGLPVLFDIGDRYRTTLRDLWVLSIVPCAAIWGAVFFAHLGVMGAALLFEASLWAGAGRAVLPSLRSSHTPDTDRAEPEPRAAVAESRRTDPPPAV